MSKSLATRLEKLERHSPPEPLVVKITSFADPPSPEEEAVLEAEVRRRIGCGETWLSPCGASGRRGVLARLRLELPRDRNASD